MKNKSKQAKNPKAIDTVQDYSSLVKLPPQTRILSILEQMLDDHESGFAPLSLEQLLRLKATLDADRPSVFIIMTVLANALDYLNHRYSGEPVNLPIISDFLAQFQQSAAQDLLSKEPSIRDGLALLKHD